MDRCPLCRATLNGADTCRRCRAELGAAQRMEEEGRALLGAALYHLSLGDDGAAWECLRRAVTMHATPVAAALLRSIYRKQRAGARGFALDPPRA